MDGPLILSTSAGVTAGVLLLAIVTIESGGWFPLRVLRGAMPAGGLQRSVFRAGHAHAGVLVIRRWSAGSSPAPPT